MNHPHDVTFDCWSCERDLPLGLLTWVDPESRCWCSYCSGEAMKEAMAMNDTRHIECNACCESALEYEADVSVQQLEGKVLECESCHVVGKVVHFEADEGPWDAGHLEFVPLTEAQRLELM